MRYIYSLFVFMIIFFMFQFLWPLILVLGVLVMAFIWYLNYKAKKVFRDQSETYYESSNTQQEFTRSTYESDDNVEKPINNGSVIDVEYTERKENDDRN